MSVSRSMFLGVAFWAGSTILAAAQPVYQTSPYGQAPVIPQSWSYDPYTSGAAPCPQGIPGDLTRCSEKMPPTYGQPSYWPAGR